MAKARVLKLVGGRILVCGLAARVASFLAAAAGSGSLQLVERSALEVILDRLGRAWNSLENFCARARGEPDSCLRHTTTPFTLRGDGLQFF